MVFEYIDSVNQHYYIKFGRWYGTDKEKSVTITFYPNKYSNQVLTTSSFTYNTDIILAEDNEWWVEEYLNDEIWNYLKRLVKNKAFI